MVIFIQPLLRMCKKVPRNGRSESLQDTGVQGILSQAKLGLLSFIMWLVDLDRKVVM